MKISQFNKLKIGDSVYLKNTYNDEYTLTEALGLDKLFKKVSVLLGKK